MVSSLLTGRSFLPPKGAAGRFASVIDALRYLVWTFGRSPEQAWIGMAVNRLTRAGRRWAALFARYQAGTLRPPRTRTGPRVRRRRRRRLRGSPRRARPGGCRRCCPEGGKLDVRCLAGALRQAVETDPETMAFLAAAPQAGRILRPLLRMLTGAPLPAVLRLPVRPRARRRAPVAPTADGGRVIARGRGRPWTARVGCSCCLQGEPGGGAAGRFRSSG